MANILSTLTDILKKSIAGNPPPPVIIQNLGPRLDDLMQVSADASGEGIDRWLTKFRELTGDVALRETLVVRALQMNFPRVAETLTLLEIITFSWGADPQTPIKFGIQWTELNKFFTQPGDKFLNLLLSKVQGLDDLKALQVLVLLLISGPQELVGLEYRQQGFFSLPVGTKPGINSDELLALIEDLINSPLTFPLPFNPPLSLADIKNKANTPAPDFIKLESPLNPNNLEGLAFELNLQSVQKAIDDAFDLGGGWKLGFTTTGSGQLKYRIEFKNNNEPDAGIAQTNNLILTLSRQKDADEAALLIGEKDGTHFSIKNISAGLHFNNSGPLFSYDLNFNQIEFALKPDFLKFLSFGLTLPTVLSFTSDVALSYVQGKGLSGQGSAGGPPAIGIEFATPVNLKIGGAGAGISVDQVLTRLEVAAGAHGLLFRILFRYGANANFGPLKMILDGAGLWIGRWTDGNAGLLLPQGIGLSLDAGPVKGGGFLKMISDHEFAGALQIKILEIGAFAYCLYKTLPSGEISFVAIIGIRLPPPGIQISFGFAVSGFGGLVGINRRADTDLLRERLASGSAGDVLFNDDPMKNAPRLLGDMQLFFPDEKGIFLIGPTLQINWLYIIKLDAGFFIELPGPRKFFIAGTAKLVIGSEDFALVYLRMDFIGGIDLTKSLIFFDAVLVNSHVLGIFRISGGVSLRIAFGENKYFLFSVGGFHPSFNPGSMELPKVPRVGVSYSIGPVWLKEEMYLAITSNTFQLGSKTEAGIEIGPISAHGWFGFDALVQFKPFHFIGTIDAGFDVEVEGISLCNVHVEGLLSGPGPLVLQAKASVSLLFFDVSGDVTIELNNNPPEQPVNIPNIPVYLKDKGELSKPENMRSEGTDPSVIYGALPEGERLFAPLGEIIWEQKRVPLNLPIQKLEGVDLGGWHTVEPSATMSSKPETDWFGVGTYLKLSDSEALNNAKFAPQQSGIRIGTTDITEGAKEDAVLNLSLIKIVKPSRFPLGDLIGLQYINSALSSMMAERSGNSKLNPGKAQVTVNDEAWNSHGANGKIQNTTALNSIQAFVNAKQTGGIALPASEKQLNLTGVI
jgi:hypothetical protein